MAGRNLQNIAVVLLLFIATFSRQAAGQGTFGQVSDPSGDAVKDSRILVSPDLISATVGASAGNLQLSVRFAPFTFNSQTISVTFNLDADQNPATGHPGVNSSGTLDAGIVGDEFLVDIGSNRAAVLRYTGPPINTFSFVGSFSATFRTDGVDVTIPLTAIGNDNGLLDFKVTTFAQFSPGTFTGILDVMPNVGLAAGRTLRVAPEVRDGGVVNNASFAPHPGPVAPGSIAAVFGSNLNDGSTLLFSNFGPDGKLVTTLGGATARISNIPAPIFYSTPGQLGVQIPIELTGLTSATIQVTVGGQTSAPRSIFLEASAPGIFTLTQDGKGAAAALHGDGVTPVTAPSPAQPGEIIVLYATGLGPVTPPLATGAPSTGNQTVTTPTVTIDGIPGEVLFSGAAPGFVGLNQINVRIPPSTRSAPNIPVLLSIGGKQSNPVTIAVSP